MCIPEGSLDLYTSTCPMCVLFRYTRCPHKRETCRNRAAHPRQDVSYITNAEIQTFNGCGFCKWAKQLPPPPSSKAGMSNPGWPGCCRSPAPSELALIPPADWPAVHTIHRTPIPVEVKAILDAVRIPYAPLFNSSSAFSSASSAASSANANTTNTNANNTSASTAPGSQGSGAPPSTSANLNGPGMGVSGIASGNSGPGPAPSAGAGSLIPATSAFTQRERKVLVRANSSPGAPGATGTGGTTTTTAPASAAARTGIAHVSAAVAIPQKARERGASSPQSRPSSLGGSGANGVRPASAERASGTGTGTITRRGTGPDKPLKRVEGFRTTPPSSMRKLADAEFHDRSVLGVKKDVEHALKRRASNAGTPLRSSASGAASMRITSKAAYSPEKTRADSVETRSRSSSKSHTVAHRDSGEKARGEMLDLEKIVAAFNISGSTTSDKHGRSQSADKTSNASAKSPNTVVSPTKSVHSPEKARSEIGDGNTDKTGVPTGNVEKSSKAAASVSSASGATEKLSKAGSPSGSSDGGNGPSNLSRSQSSQSDARSVSSGGSGSGSGSTITSDGGFTDYLSDESEAELQRQAVERAALLEQNRMEEAEFRLARQQLAHVDLRPPHAWTTGVGRKAINAGYLRG